MTEKIIGDLLLVFSFAANLLAGFAFYKAARGNKSYEGIGIKVYHVLFVSVTLAAIHLFYLFLSHNYAFKYVYDYSDRALGFFYLFSAFWAGQEGTYLLWFFMAVCFGYLIIYRAGKYRNWAMVIFTITNLFCLVLLWKVSPFALLDFFSLNGAGLNPLLQDPWMVIHPPVIFVGYSVTAVPFAIAMAALIIDDYSGWVKLTFPWVCVAAVMLGAGNILGGYWAYKTLGWGGYWAWDPVENSSFIPWFISLALVHGLLIEKRTGALRRTNLMMSAFLFVLVVYGTFLTRSGVLADFSVHSFVDLGINNYLVGFLALFTVGSLTLFIRRAGTIESAPLEYNYFGREFSLFMGMMILFVFSVVVLFWTSLPITTRFFTSEPRAADLSTYNGFALPFAVLFSLFLTVAPLTKYGTFVPKNWKVKLIAFAVLSTMIGFGLFYFILGVSLVFAVMFATVCTTMMMYLQKRDLVRPLLPALLVFILTIVVAALLGVDRYMYILFLAAAAMAATANLLALFAYLPGRWKNMGGQMAHFGFGIMLLGVLGSTAFTSNEKLILTQGDSGTAYDLNVTYLGMADDIMKPKNELLLQIEDNGKISQGRPQLYYSRKLDGLMKKPHIEKSLFYDLYFSPENIREGQHKEGFVLAKGKSQTVGDYTFTFDSYEMGAHGEKGQGMKVLAKVDISYGDTTVRVVPAIHVITGEDGQSHQTDVPATFGEQDQYSISIDRILADQGAVGLRVPGLADHFTEPEQLVLDISKKPIINLVWVGTTLILIGGAIVFLRRRDEMFA